MSTTEITSKIEALKELEALIEEAKAEAEALRDEIKTEMLNRNTEEMEAGQVHCSLDTRSEPEIRFHRFQKGDA